MMFIPSNLAIVQYSLLIFALLSWTLHASTIPATALINEGTVLDPYEQTLKNSNVDSEDHPWADLIQKRYANKVIRGDSRLWAIPYRFGKRGAMPYRFGKRRQTPIHFDQMHLLLH